MTKIPMDRPLDQAEIQRALAEAILKDAKATKRGHIWPPHLVSPEVLGRSLGLAGKELSRFIRNNRHDSFTDTADRFVNRLIAVGVLERAWEMSQASPQDFYRLSEDGEKQLENLTSLESTLTLEFIESLQDDELMRRCGHEVIRSGKPDTLIREACTVLEDRVRKTTSAPMTVDRGALAGQYFAPDHAKIVFSDVESVQRAAMYLYGGMLTFGSPFHHLLVDFPAKRARQIVGFIDTLLVMLDEAAKHQSTGTPELP